MWEESLEIQHNEEREADREREYSDRERYDDNEPTTFERSNPLLPKMMGGSYSKYFHTEEEIYAAEEEVTANYVHDERFGII